MHLTLQHICQYLPHGLKYVNEENTDYVFQIESVFNDGVNLVDDDSGYDFVRFDQDSHLKPIVRPLSDITELITHKGEQLIPVCRMITHGAHNDFWTNPKIDHLYWHDIKLLHSMFFDLDGLIESGLAISTYDLPEDPYK